MTKMTPPTTLATTARLAAGSLALVLVGALAGCGGSADEPTVSTAATVPTSSTTSSTTRQASPSSSSSSSSSSTGRTLVVTVQGKKVTPAPSTVDLAVGKTLTLVVTSDHDDQLHAHGFEVETTLKAGQSTTVTLTGREPGVYEVETHHPALRLLKIAVR